MEEFKVVIFDLAPDKSPGPDEYHPFFYQKYWTLVGNSFYRVFKAFFFFGKILKEINHTFITFISKFEAPSDPNHFMPISLCSTIYNFFSNIMAKRLKVMLGKIIHPLQGVFVPERLTKDDVLQAHENFQFLKLKKRN